MLDEEMCERLPQEAKPRIALNALAELRRLINSQSHSRLDVDDCAQSATGGKGAQRPDSGGATAGAALRRRRNLDAAAGASTGTLPNSLEGTTGKRFEKPRREVR
jgi:hypothetical protein